MATYRRRRNSWQVQIRRAGYPSLNKTFRSKVTAAHWVHEQERDADLNGLPASPADKKLRLFDLLCRYESEVVVLKRGANRERYKLQILKRSFLASLTLSNVTSAAIATFLDNRLKTVSTGTVRRELAILRHCFEISRREWSAPLNSRASR
jgi:hypothetical protein